MRRALRVIGEDPERTLPTSLLCCSHSATCPHEPSPGLPATTRRAPWTAAPSPAPAYVGMLMEPDDQLVQAARGVRQREARRDLQAYARRRMVNRDTRILAGLAPLIDRAKAAGLDADTIAALAAGREA